jgi:hypothetical protein
VLPSTTLPSGNVEVVCSILMTVGETFEPVQAATVIVELSSLRINAT